MSESSSRASASFGASVQAPVGSNEPREAEPRVWLVVGEKRGDNAQVRNLARAVGWSFSEKMIRMAPEWVEGKPRVRASLDHIDRAASDVLEPPWPDLVMTAGRRLASVALHIKRASGGHTRVVVLGKPRGSASDFDLVVTASHYSVRGGAVRGGARGEAANVARHALPLNQLDLEALADAKKAWVGRLLLLPRPLTALLVGGPTGGLRFDVETARELLTRTREVVDAQRGSLYVTTSRRTPRAVTDYLREACSVNDQLYLYDEHTPAADNPYPGLLALADDFVVTSDSLSMMVEVAQLGRPLRIHPLERDAGAVEKALEACRFLKPLSPRTDEIPGGGLMARVMSRLGWPIHSRDLSAISIRLVEMGLAGWLGEPKVKPVPFVDEALDEVATRIRALLR